MLFALICADKPNALELRMQTRPAHLDYVADLGAQLVFAGPFLDDDGKSNGSLVVIEAKDMDAAKQVAARDPYAQAGLFADVDIRPWNWIVNKPEGM